jgi:CMP-N,N'-diacetyllegionaminic acid synthase
MRVLGLIPARGGSKGVPRKNVRFVCGKPLLQYTAEAALKSCRLSSVVLSTDDSEIAEIGSACGLRVPFLRPAELAEDQTPTLPVVQHAVSWLENRGEHFDAVCLLQPTNPLRSPEIIDGCVSLLESSGADAVITVLPVPTEYNPHWVYFNDDCGRIRLSTGESSPIPRRQSLPPAFHREGSVYVTRRDVIIEQNSLYGTYLLGLPISPECSINIDLPEDLLAAERLIEQMR